ncbi:hypothetical protein F4776DRAFT_671327 [Hypoxylon sp. NC0597]|nr:hypothetical protein F4776DRAFT_671327 [Hypoxylon sp. NC0597]
MSEHNAPSFPVGEDTASSKFPLQETGSAEREQGGDLGEGKIGEPPVRGIQVPKRKNTAPDSEEAPRKRAKETSIAEQSLPEMPIQHYVWPEEQAEKIWNQIFPGRKKIQKGGPFYLPFPCERNRNECLVKGIGHGNELADNRYVHVVWAPARGEFGKHPCWNVYLSPVSGTVNTDDVAFLWAIASTWGVLTHWYGEMLTSRKDVNFASFFEKCVREGLANLGCEEKAKRWNERAAAYEELAKEQAKEFQEAKKAATEYIIGLLEASSNLEARKANLHLWVLNPNRHQTIIKKRDLARKVWMENRILFFDTEDTINDWFRSFGGPRELPDRPSRASMAV